MGNEEREIVDGCKKIGLSIPRLAVNAGNVKPLIFAYFTHSNGSFNSCFTAKW
ncbi:hypothetical protein QE390_004471 [Siphonobacter sp. SORGH_AS 1065]|nr:hypothetical protein [Siphonobacter sp. SORGH_AS_1065]